VPRPTARSAPFRPLIRIARKRRQRHRAPLPPPAPIALDAPHKTGARGHRPGAESSMRAACRSRATAECTAFGPPVPPLDAQLPSSKNAPSVRRNNKGE